MDYVRQELDYLSQELKRFGRLKFKTSKKPSTVTLLPLSLEEFKPILEKLKSFCAYITLSFPHSNEEVVYWQDCLLPLERVVKRVGIEYLHSSIVLAGGVVVHLYYPYNRIKQHFLLLSLTPPTEEEEKT